MTTQARELAKIVTNAGDINLVDDISLASDGAVLNFGADNDVTLTHVADTALLLNSSRQLQFGDSGTYIHQSADGVLDLVADTEIEINATTVDINNTNCNIDGTLTVNNLTVNGTTSGISSSPAADDISTGDAAVTIGTSSGSITLDSPADIILDADSDSIKFKDGGTEYGKIYGASDNFYLNAATQDKDIIFVGDDGGSSVTALTLDMSEGGIAEFAAQIRAPSQATSAPTFAFTNDTDTGISRPTTNALNIVTGGTERVRVDAEGNIEFGSQKQNTNWSQFFNALSGNYGSHISMQNNNVPVISVGNNFYINNSTANERILAYPTQQLKLSHEGHFLFENAASGTAGATFSFTEVMRVALGGSVHIGTGGGEANGSTGGCSFSADTSDRRNFICSTTGTGTLELIEFRNPNGTVGDIKVSGSATSYSTSSDYRLKENVNYTWDATSRLKQLKPARFNFKADADTTVDGFLAHEVSSIVPEAISGEKDAMHPAVLYVEGDEIPEGKNVGDVKEEAKIKPQGIDHSKLVPLLVKTIQELEARITTLEG